MKIVHIQGICIVSNLQEKLEKELLKLEAKGYEVKKVVNNFGAYSVISLLLGLLSGTIKVYTIIAEKKLLCFLISKIYNILPVFNIKVWVYGKYHSIQHRH